MTTLTVVFRVGAFGPALKGIFSTPQKAKTYIKNSGIKKELFTEEFELDYEPE